ncbi:MAG: hypothetical protein ACOCVA_04890 [Prolixibacteraceae bacterium]
MNTNQRRVLKWWHSGRDYREGIHLLSDLNLTKNRVMVDTLMKPGKEKFQKNHEKLHYEVAKAAGLNWKKMPPLPPSMQNTDDVLPKTKNNPAEKTESTTTSARQNQNPPAETKRVPLISDKPIGDYPKIIRRLKYEYSNLYTERSLQHKKMIAVPDKNSPENMQVRADCRQQMKEISAKMEYLYGFIEQYEKKGTIPLEEEVWPKPKKQEDELPDSADDLKKKKKKLKSANTKDRNKLLYQQNRIGKKENPMPDGPKRKKIELRIKDRMQEIETIELKLLDVEK